MSSAELTAWMAYEREFGLLGDERADRLAAFVMTAMSNGLAALSGSRSRFEVADFLPRWSERPNPDTLKGESTVRKHPNMTKFERMAAEMGWVA